MSDWVDVLLLEIGQELDAYEVSMIRDAIEKYCPFKRGVAYQEVPTKPQHVWQFYANGSFCTRCGAAIGSGQECRP